MKIIKNLYSNEKFEHSVIQRLVMRLPNPDNILYMDDSMKVKTSSIKTIDNCTVRLPGYEFDIHVGVSTHNVIDSPLENIDPKKTQDYRCDRFIYKNIWTFDLIHLYKPGGDHHYAFELILEGSNISEHPPEYYTKSAIMKLLDFNTAVNS